MLLTYPTRSKPPVVVSTSAVVCLLAVFCAMRALAEGQNATTAPSTQPVSENSIGRWFSELNSSDPSLRQAARANLMRLKRDRLVELRGVVEQSRPLAPAQIAALRPIVQEVFLSGEPYNKDQAHGFLGIFMESAVLSVRDLAGASDPVETPGVVVADRIPGFCASRSLLDGDMILGMANSPRLFRSSLDLKQAIGGLEPGTTVQLKVLRNGQVIDVRITLDALPRDIDQDGGETFRLTRAAQFKTFWQQEFASLLKDDRVTATQVNASK